MVVRYAAFWFWEIARLWSRSGKGKTNKQKKTQKNPNNNQKKKKKSGGRALCD